VACAGLGAALVAREAGSRLAGVLAGALFLALSPTIIWAALYKQDFPALAFGLVGLVWLARWPGGR
jgi:4-amino-4-deoxy-L-arabinose transferase-like glycosyltransferase